MGGLFSPSKSSSKLPKWAVPYVQSGLGEAQNVYNENKENLSGLSGLASEAFGVAAPKAYGQNPFLDHSQGAARTITDGFFLGQNPGQATYDRLQAPAGFSGDIRSTGMRMGGQPNSVRRVPANDPSMGLLSGMATNTAPRAGTSLITASANGVNPGDAMAMRGAGGSNPGDQFASAVAQGQYLNRQPSADLYGEMMDRGYSTSNPFVDDIIRQNDENVTRQANRLFGSRGMGAGIGSAFADVVSKNLANSGNQIRYQNYSDAENRRLAAAGQSDAAYSAERGRMDAASGLLSDNFNAARNRDLQAGGLLADSFNTGMDRMLSAGQALGQNDLASRAQQLSAAQSLGTQYNAGADRGLQQQGLSLEAAKAADASQNSQVDQILRAIGLSPELNAAQYAGYAPTTDLLKTAAALPYLGIDSLQAALANLAGTSRVQQSSGPGLGYSVATALAGNPSLLKNS